MQSALELLLASFRQELDRMIAAAPRFVLALVVFLVFVWLGRVLGRLLAQALNRGQLSQTHRSFFRGLVAWLVASVGAAVALNVIGLGGLAAGLVTSGGITAVVLGFAFRQIGENLLAGFFLAFSRPFELGDTIESDGVIGGVEGIELRSTHIRTADGRDVYIPSAQIFNMPLTNYTRDNLRRPSFRIGVDYRDDLPAARELLATTIVQVAGVLAEPPSRVAAAALQAAYVEIEVAFWLDTSMSNITTVTGEAIERCVSALAAGGYRFSSEVTTGVELVGGPAAS